MDRFLFVFGLVVFLICVIFFVMNVFTQYYGLSFILSVFGMLNASIAIGVSEILRALQLKNK
ncbi:hypothetical protein HMI01_10310 [Halolactibacillus miurensis]|uniref:Uncharacterized protein n=1 Tax=Halolactibacillus miurensis TaxID=306541 RepID=A0ABQ0VSA7_9BACI|nr:hypothetical protein [Halolactibacillus miurensis]GEM04043.1 hypothetical protein HMI01_10310 [Halolactibacillus miurensis]